MNSVYEREFNDMYISIYVAAFFGVYIFITYFYNYMYLLHCFVILQFILSSKATYYCILIIALDFLEIFLVKKLWYVKIYPPLFKIKYRKMSEPWLTFYTLTLEVLFPLNETKFWIFQRKDHLL